MRVSRSWLGVAGVMLAGLAQAMSILTPGVGRPLWWLQMASLTFLVARLQRTASVRQAMASGWLFATVWLCGTFWWLYVSMHTYGGIAAPLAAIAVVSLAAFLSLYYALACGVFAALRRGAWLSDAFLFASLWLLAELMRATWFTGFPWGESGYAHVEGPLAALAPVVGVHGISWMAALLAASCAAVYGPAAAQGQRWLPAAGVLIILSGCTWLGLTREDAPQGAGRLTVALLQGNIPQDEKFHAGTGIPQALEWYGQQLVEAKAALVVAPETAIPLLPRQLPDGYLERLERHYAQGGQAALIGMPLGSLREGYTNAAVGLKPDGPAYRYAKHHLVPFGEFIPPLFRWFTDAMRIPLGDFERGAVGQPSMAWLGQRLAPNICYEDLFGEELGVRFADPALAPTMLVNLSNIGWFGDTVAIDQHLQISRMRALEFDRTMLRATNTGATAIIDRRGRVTHALPRLTQGVLAGEADGATTQTMYAKWVSRLGLWPLWLLALGVPAGCWLQPGLRVGRRRS